MRESFKYIRIVIEINLKFYFRGQGHTQESMKYLFTLETHKYIHDLCIILSLSLSPSLTWLVIAIFCYTSIQRHYYHHYCIECSVEKFCTLLSKLLFQYFFVILYFISFSLTAFVRNLLRVSCQ